MIQTPINNTVFVTKSEHDLLRQEMEEGFSKVDNKLTHLTEAMILGDDKIYIEMGRRFDEMDRKIDGGLEKVDDRLKGLGVDVGVLKSDMGNLKTEMVGLKMDMLLIINHFGIKG